MIYIIDNDKAYELHRLYFVEADPAVMEPLLGALQKAWRRGCYNCGKLRGEVMGPRHCGGFYDFRKSSFLAGTAPKITWLSSDDRSLTVAQWLAILADDLQEGIDGAEVSDLVAARDFIQLATEIWPNPWLMKMKFIEVK